MKALDRGTLVTVVTSVLLTLTAVRLVQANLASWSERQATSRNAANIARFGSLSGVTTHGDTWSIDETTNENTLLYSVSTATTEHDLAFWRDVASRSRRTLSDLRFVGVCDKGHGCQVNEAVAGFTVLSFMDPYQMHILANARRQHRAILYHGTRFVSAIALQPDPAMVADRIVSAALEGGKKP
jgi:hypothetical protein